MDNADTEEAVTPRFLTPKAASKRYGVATQTFANWRCQDIGPPFHKISPGRAGRVRYDVLELDLWFSKGSAREPAPPAEPGAGAAT